MFGQWQKFLIHQCIYHLYLEYACAGTAHCPYRCIFLWLTKDFSMLIVKTNFRMWKKGKECSWSKRKLKKLMWWFIGEETKEERRDKNSLYYIFHLIQSLVTSCFNIIIISSLIFMNASSFHPFGWRNQSLKLSIIISYYL